MPLVESTYKPSYLLKSSHINTVFRTLFTTNRVNYTRERLELNEALCASYLLLFYLRTNRLFCGESSSDFTDFYDGDFI